MKIDFSQTFKDLDGTEIKQQDKVLTLGMVCAQACIANFQDEQSLDVKEKIERNKIAEKIYSGGEKDMSLDELSTIKKLVNKVYGTRLVALVCNLIEPSSPE